MTEVSPGGGTQLDRIDGKLDQVLDRLTRMEERQSSLAGMVEAHDHRLRDFDERLRAQSGDIIELRAKAEGSQEVQQIQHQHLSGRWKMIGTAAIAAASVAGGFLSRIFFP